MHRHVSTLSSVDSFSIRITPAARIFTLSGECRRLDYGLARNHKETFSEYYNGITGSGGDAGTKPYADGFAALKSLDSNSDNLFTSADTAFGNVRVWVDSDHDGETDAGELRTLASLGITQINLNKQNESGLVRDGNEILASGTFVQSGVTKEALAASFIADPGGHTFVASGTGTKDTSQTGVTSYVAGSASGEAIAVSAKGVINFKYKIKDILNNAGMTLVDPASVATEKFRIAA